MMTPLQSFEEIGEQLRRALDRVEAADLPHDQRLGLIGPLTQAYTHAVLQASDIRRAALQRALPASRVRQ